MRSRHQTRVEHQDWEVQRRVVRQERDSRGHTLVFGRDQFRVPGHVSFYRDLETMRMVTIETLRKTPLK